jgi:hypothetical protein
VKHKIVYKIGLACGLLTWVVGLIIFLTWWIARAFFAVDLDDCMVYGFLWTQAAFYIGIGLLMTFVLEQNYPNYLKQAIGGFGLILLNIPIFFVVLIAFGELEDRAYIKIHNNTKQDNLELTLKASDFEKGLGTLDDNQTSVDFYYPKPIYDLGNARQYRMDTVTLIVKDNLTTHYLTLPRIDRGQCVKLYIDKEFRLTNKWD